MKIENDQQNGCTVYTLDGGSGFGAQPISIKIQKGGEFLEKNTYGFEIEFCSQDSPVFGYTHVTVMQLNVDSTLPWKVETDSDNVFEVVTPKLTFDDANMANRCKSELAKILVDSVTPQVTVEDWAPAAVLKMRELLCRFGIKPAASDDNSNDLGISTFFEPASWDDVNSQLTEENIDDKTQVESAAQLMVTNKDTWPEYVGRIKLSRSAKDERRRFSSQLNMPMTLPGYFLYVRHKFLKSVQHFEDRSWDKKDAPEQRAVDKKANWYWRTVLWRALGSIKWGASNWLDLRLTDWTLDKTRRVGILYVVVSKLLSGALGALSEERQLTYQKDRAHYPCDDEPLRSFHSHLKSLTGLWFKAPLFSVLSDSKDINGQSAWILNLADVLDGGQIAWKAAFFETEEAIKGRDDLQELVWSAGFFGNAVRIRCLLEAIRRVERELAGFLRRWVGGKLTELDEQWILLPPRDALRKRFLHYSEAAPWEGRFDTMYPSLTASNTQPAYLIEHRFN